MSGKNSIKLNRELICLVERIDLDNLALTFCDMDADDQAEFFKIVASRFGDHTGVPGLQVSSIAAQLSSSAKVFIKNLNEFMDD